MINKNMNEKQQENQQDQTVVDKHKQPDDTGGFYLQGHVKIFDPETQEIFLQGRA